MEPEPTLLHDYPEPEEVQGWKAWFEDGSSITSEEAKWEDLADGMQVLMIYFDSPNRQILSGESFYYNPYKGKGADPVEGTLIDYDELMSIQDAAMADDWHP